MQLGWAGGARDNPSLQKGDEASPDLLSSPGRETVCHHKLREEANRKQGPLQIQEAGSKQVRWVPGRSPAHPSAQHGGTGPRALQLLSSGT